MAWQSAPLETEFTDFERRARLGFRSVGGRMRVNGQVLLTRTQAGSSLVLVTDLQPQGVFKLLAPIMGLMLGP